MIYAGILAGGRTPGMPIQFSLLGTKPILIHTLEQFIIHQQIDRILIAVPKEWMVHTRDLLIKFYPDVDAQVVQGGANKNLSIIQFIRHIERTYGITPEDIILCHDAIRPFVTQRIISENIAIAAAQGVANTVMRTVDTIILSNDGRAISDMPERGYTFAEQTPQSFPVARLQSLLEQTDDTLLQQFDDTAKLFFQNGQKVSLVQGEYSNIKIVTAYDVEVANALLKEKKL